MEERFMLLEVSLYIRWSIYFGSDIYNFYFLVISFGYIKVYGGEFYIVGYNYISIVVLYFSLKYIYCENVGKYGFY